MIYRHKNPTILTLVRIDKIQYRDSKRIKAKLSLLTQSLDIIELRKNYTLPSNFFENFTLHNAPVEIPLVHEELLTLDDYKDWSIDGPENLPKEIV